jgi:secreted trypsin-like serine protease
MVCTGSGIPGETKGAGKGDSGGPLLMPGDQGVQIVGVASWIYPKDDRGRVSDNGVTVFTRVDKYVDWIIATPGR